MKFFKNTAAVLALLTIGFVHTKQVGKKATTTSPITSPIKPSPQPQIKQQPLLQPGTYRKFLAELKSMKTDDVFTPNKSQFTDKIVQLFARAQISNLHQLAGMELFGALTSLHLIGTIISIEEISNKIMKSEIEKKFEPLTEDLKTRVKALVEAQQIDKPNINEQNKQKMQNYLRIQTGIALNEFINKKGLDNEDMKEICEKIDMLLRQAHQDYAQLGIDEGNMAYYIAKEEIINKLSELSPATMLQLANYMISTRETDKDIMEIGMALKRSANEQKLSKKEIKKDETPTEADKNRRKADVLTGCINTVLRKYNNLNDENALHYILDSKQYNFNNIKTVLDKIIIDVLKCSDNQEAVKMMLIISLRENYFAKLTSEQKKEITDYINLYFFTLT